MHPPTLFVREQGTGPPLLFLHALGASSQYWSGQLDPLDSAHRCLMPDLLGFGNSLKPQSCAYTVDDHLTALRATLIELKAVDEPMTLIGHSLGAILATEYAARYPAQVEGLVVLGLPRYDNEAAARAYIGAHGDLLTRITIANGRLAHLLCLGMHKAPRLAARIAIAVAPQFPPVVAADAVRHTWASYSGTLQHCILDHDLTPALGRLPEIPILALHGTEDHSSPLPAVEALAVQMSNVSLRRIAGGHHLFLAQNHACVQAILHFLTREGGSEHQ